MSSRSDGKKKASRGRVDDAVGTDPPDDDVDGLFHGMVRKAEGKLANGLPVGSGADAVVIGLPFRSFSQQWLHHNTGFALGRMTVYIGESGSCKTALQAETMRLHLEASPQSEVIYNETEARDSRVLRMSIIGQENARYKSGRERVIRSKCDSIQEWQTRCTEPIRFLTDKYAKSDGPKDTYMVAVDSMTGVTSQQAIDKIEETGHASLTHAIDANLLNTYLKWVGGRVADWPLSFVATNHIKFNVEERNGRTFRVPRIPGGDAIRFHATTILMLRGFGETDRQDVDGGYRVSISTYKNSLGERNKELEVEMNWWYQEDGSQVTVWDWHAATAKLLGRHQADEKNFPDLRDVVDFPQFNPSARSCTCPRVGIKGRPAPFAEVGQAVAADAGLMADLHRYYGIHQVVPFRPGVPWRKQLLDAYAAGLTRAAAAPGDDVVPAE